MNNVSGNIGSRAAAGSAGAAILSAVFAVAVGAPAIAAVKSADHSLPSPTAMTAARPGNGQNAQYETARTRETDETNDTSSDLMSLFKVEDAAEAIAEGEKTGASGLVAGHQAVMGWPAVRARLRQNGTAPSELITADGAVAALRNALRSTVNIARSANELTGALAPLFTRAGDKVPADVHYLDYLGRSIKLDVSSGDWARAQREATELRTRWIAAEIVNGLEAIC